MSEMTPKQIREGQASLLPLMVRLKLANWKPGDLRCGECDNGITADMVDDCPFCNSGQTPQ